MSNQRFLKFGKYKVIIVTAIIDGVEFSFHHNILITNNTTFEEYYHLVKDIIVNNYEVGYPVEVIPLFRVIVWNLNNYKNKKIKLTSSSKSASSLTLGFLPTLHPIFIRILHSSPSFSFGFASLPS